MVCDDRLGRYIEAWEAYKTTSIKRAPRIKFYIYLMPKFRKATNFDNNNFTGNSNSMGNHNFQRRCVFNRNNKQMKK